MMLLYRNLGLSTEHAICWCTCVLRTMGKLTTRAVRDSIVQTGKATVEKGEGTNRAHRRDRVLMPDSQTQLTRDRIFLKPAIPRGSIRRIQTVELPCDAA